MHKLRLKEVTGCRGKHFGGCPVVYQAHELASTLAVQSSASSQQRPFEGITNTYRRPQRHGLDLVSDLSDAADEAS
jgi:hypothetical protein